MPVTQIDPIPALVVYDLQKSSVQNPLIHPVEDIVGNAVKLIKAFRERDYAVVLINGDALPPGRTEYNPAGGAAELPDDWGDLIPELEQRPSDVVITKGGWGGFVGTVLHDRLQELGVTQVILLGIASSYGVLATALPAYDLGYNVVVVTDATTDLTPEGHEYVFSRVFPMVSQLSTTQEVLDLL